MSVTKQVIYAFVAIIFIVACAGLYTVMTGPDHGNSNVYIECPDVIPNAPSS